VTGRLGGWEGGGVVAATEGLRRVPHPAETPTHVICCTPDSIFFLFLHGWVECCATPVLLLCPTLVTRCTCCCKSKFGVRSCRQGGLAPSASPEHGKNNIIEPCRHPKAQSTPQHDTKFLAVGIGCHSPFTQFMCGSGG
jgi:hypothetical protein